MKRWQRLLAFVLSFSLVHVTTIQSVHAGLIPTEEIARLADGSTADSGHARLAAVMARADVRSEMVRLGVDPAVAAERTAALSDAEAASLAGQFDSAPAGSGLVGTLVFLFLVLLFTDIMGWTKVFPFTRSMR